MRRPSPSSSFALCVLLVVSACDGGTAAPDAGADADADAASDAGSDSATRDASQHVDASADAHPDAPDAPDASDASTPDASTPDASTSDAGTDAQVCLFGYVDVDDDAYGVGVAVAFCEVAVLPVGFAAVAGDCDDAAVLVHPWAQDPIADGVDQDCDGNEVCFVDADSDGHRTSWPTTIVSADADCDDFGEASAALPADDCNDQRAFEHPGHEEVCDGYDNDCDVGGLQGDADADDDGYLACDDFVDQLAHDFADGGADCAPDDPSSYQLAVAYADHDLDGFGAGPAIEVCTGDVDRPGHSDVASDCDDADAFVFPGAPEVPGDGLVQDCDRGADLVLDEAHAVFVDAACVASCGEGTRASPFTSIAPALAAAGSTRVVAIAGGEYEGGFVLRTALYGGFDPSNWSARDPALFVTRISGDYGSIYVVRTEGDSASIDGVSLDTPWGLVLDVGANTTLSDVVIAATGSSRPRGIEVMDDFVLRARRSVITAGKVNAGEAKGIALGDGARVFFERCTITAQSSSFENCAVEMRHLPAVGIFLDSTIVARHGDGSGSTSEGSGICWGDPYAYREGTVSALYLGRNTIRGPDSLAESSGVAMRGGHLVAVANDIRGGDSDVHGGTSTGLACGEQSYATSVSNILVGGAAQNSVGVALPASGYFVHDTLVGNGTRMSYGARDVVRALDLVFVNNLFAATQAWGRTVGVELGAGDVVLRGNGFDMPFANALVTVPGHAFTTTSAIDACTFGGCVSAEGNVAIAPSFVGGAPFDYHVVAATPTSAPGPWYTGGLDAFDIDADARPGTDGVRAIGADEGP